MTSPPARTIFRLSNIEDVPSDKSQVSVLKYFGAQANRLLSYSVASVSGTGIAVCSCTVLPLFAGIYLRGAGMAYGWLME